MKSYKKLVIGILVVVLLVFGLANMLFYLQSRGSGEKPYMLEIGHMVQNMQQKVANGQTVTIPDVTSCEYVRRIIVCKSSEDIVKSSRYEYCIKEVDGVLYRFEYERSINEKQYAILLNASILVMAICLIAVIYYIAKRIIIPFGQMEEIPYELAKGNLAVELKEEKTKYFGRYIWATNMLKENLAMRREKELDMHKEKKLLLLSLTHDIKTPLSVIKLNTQALLRGLYQEEEKRKQALTSIDEKVEEIQQYVTQIVAASREDFMDLSCKEEEFYLVDVLQKIETYYKGKMDLKKITFEIGNYSNCLLSGDFARLTEVIQNLIENAIKYGDGERIVLSFEQEEGCQLITVENSGCSLPKEEMSKLFDSFYRGSNAGKKPGSGLGLYICRKLMTNMNGDIFLKQENDCFRATIVVRMS